MKLVGEVGVEPTQPEGSGFTDRPDSPTSALPYIMITARCLAQAASSDASE